MTAVPRGNSMDSFGAQTPKHGNYSRQGPSTCDIPSFKIVVVGDYAVGKTSLIKQLTTRSFAMQNAATIGVEFKEHRLADCILQLWDIAGQQYCSSMTKQYYRFTTAAIVVADVTNEVSFQVALEWKNDILTKMGSVAGSAPGATSNGTLASLSPTGPRGNSGGGVTNSGRLVSPTRSMNGDSDQYPVTPERGGSPQPTSPDTGRNAKRTVSVPPDPEVPIFLFANKGDLLDNHSAAPDFDTEEKIVEFAQNNGFYGCVVTTATEFTNVVDAFTVVAQAAATHQNATEHFGVGARSTVQLTRVKRKQEKRQCCRKS